MATKKANVMTPEEKRIDLQEQANELLIETTSEMSNEEIQTLINDELGTDTKLDENDGKDETAGDNDAPLDDEPEVEEKPKAAAKPKVAPKRKASTKRVVAPKREKQDADEEMMEVEIMKGYVPIDTAMLEELGFQHKLPVGLVCELPVKEAKRCIKRGIASFPEDEDDELDAELG